jgi:orotate phosphoribosyltransferase
VIVLEDVTTTGGSSLKAVAAVRERGARLRKVVTIVDRLEGAEAAFAKEGIELVALFDRNDFLDG